MSEKIKVLLSEEEVDSRIKQIAESQQGLCRQRNPFNLCIKGRRVLYM